MSKPEQSPLLAPIIFGTKESLAAQGEHVRNERLEALVTNGIKEEANVRMLSSNAAQSVLVVMA